MFAGSQHNTLAFTYTPDASALSGTTSTSRLISNGAISLQVPAGWSAPSTSATAPGYVTVSVQHPQGIFDNAPTPAVSVSGQTILISGVTAEGDGPNGSFDVLLITYGARIKGGPGATAPSTVGTQTWQAQEKATANGTLTNLASSPAIEAVANVAADRSGTLAAETALVSAGEHQRIVFTYTAATGGMVNGTVTLTVPAGWSAPLTSPSAAVIVTSNAGTIAVADREIVVSKVTLLAGQTFAIDYGVGNSGPNCTNIYCTQASLLGGVTLTAIAPATPGT